MAKIYAGSIGTVIQLDTGRDLSAATSLSIEAFRPDGSLTSWPADAIGTAVSVTTDADTLNLPGLWLLQAKLTTPAGEWLGETARLSVYRAFA